MYIKNELKINALKI